MSDERPRRARTDHDRHARARTPVAGVPVEIDREATPPPQEMPSIARSRTPTPDEVKLSLDAMEAQIRKLTAATAEVWDARHTGDRFDRLDHRFDRLDERLEKYAERVYRAEQGGESAWQAVKDLGPTLTGIQREMGETTRLADGVDRLVARFDEHSDRLSSIETEQHLAAQRFETHDQRDQEIAETVSTIAVRVTALEHHNTTEGALAKVRRSLVARTPRERAIAVGIKAVLIAAASFITAAGAYLFATHGG